jgi:hypothetical protein
MRVALLSLAFIPDFLLFMMLGFYGFAYTGMVCALLVWAERTYRKRIIVMILGALFLSFASALHPAIVSQTLGSTYLPDVAAVSSPQNELWGVPYGSAHLVRFLFFALAAMLYWAGGRWLASRPQ